LNKDESKSFIQNTESIAVLRKTIAKIQSESQGVKIGLTGLPILEHDEMESSESSMTVATILSFVGVFLVLVAGFGSVRHSLMAMASLLIGLVCSLGYTVLAVGHLNILSSAFGAILIGLGINYGIYFIASYLKFREKGIALDDALVDTAACVGPGIAISSLSTAMAFLAAGFTEFTGVAEMGRIAGGGIILCLAAAFLMLPAIIKLCDSWKTDWRMPEPLNFDRWLAPVIARPWFAIVAVTVLTGILALGLGRLRYDYNLLSLQPAGLESVELEKKLLAETHESVYFALSMAKTPAEAAILKEKFLKLPTVERVEEIATRFTDGAEKSQIIDRIRSRLAGLPERAPQIRVAPPYELSQKISAAQQLVAANVRVAKFQQQFQEIQSLLGQLPQEEYYKRLSEYQQRVAGELLQWLHVLQAVTNAQPPTPADLPQGLVSRFIGSKGSHLLRIYVKGDFWNIDNMRKFVENVRSVDPNVTGNPVQIYEASRQMRLSYERAAVFALMAIIPVLALNFGTLSAIFLAIIPLIADLLQTFGIMGLLDMPLNSANMIGLSLMLGMGMENGILITQDYLCQKGRYRMSGSTGVAVVLNTLTTMVGFAVLMLAAHRGLQSLGRMLAIGMGCSMISALLILPTLMTWLTRNRKEEISETPEEEIGQEIENVTRHDGSLDLETHFPDDELPAHSYRRMDRQHPTLSGTHRPPRTADWTTTSETETDEKTSMYGGA
jgi:hopanoid biosynthesis associated RND transporter like protein HpnN